MSNSFVRVPPDSTGKKILTTEHTIDGELFQGQNFHLSDFHNPEFAQRIDNRGSANVRFVEGQPQFGGFGGLKTTEQYLIGSYTHSLKTYNSLFTIQEFNGGVNTLDVQTASNVLQTNGTLDSRVVRTTNRYHHYIPGVSNLSILTVSCGDAGKVGNTRRWGLFDDNDGIYFELQDSTLNVVIRSSVTGVITETKVPQAQWNKDVLNGSGISSFAINLTNVQVWWIDYQWLGAGRVRFGVFDGDGSRLVAHEVENAGQNTLPYMRSGTLPLRTENVNTAATGSSSDLREVCLAVHTESGNPNYTYWRYQTASVTDTLINNTETALESFRAVSTVNGLHNSAQILPESISVFTDQPVEVTLWSDTQVSTGVWNSAGDSLLQSNISKDVLYAGSTRYKTVFVKDAQNFDLSGVFPGEDEGIQVNADGTPVNWTFTIKRLTAVDTTVTLTMGYRELW